MAVNKRCDHLANRGVKSSAHYHGKNLILFVLLIPNLPTRLLRSWRQGGSLQMLCKLIPCLAGVRKGDLGYA